MTAIMITDAGSKQYRECTREQRRAPTEESFCLRALLNQLERIGPRLVRETTVKVAARHPAS